MRNACFIMELHLWLTVTNNLAGRLISNLTRTAS